MTTLFQPRNELCPWIGGKWESEKKGLPTVPWPSQTLPEAAMSRAPQVKFVTGARNECAQ